MGILDIIGIVLIVAGAIILLVAIITSIVKHDPIAGFWGDDVYEQGGMFEGDKPKFLYFFRPTVLKRILIILSPFLIAGGIVLICI